MEVVDGASDESGELLMAALKRSKHLVLEMWAHMSVPKQHEKKHPVLLCCAVAAAATAITCYCAL
jgi:hypothetical protein